MRRVAAAVVAALVCGLLASCSDGRAEKAEPCGAAVARPGGGHWTCVFHDDFDGTALDTSAWTVLSTRDSGYRNGPECYLGAGSPLGSDDVSVGDGVLTLTARQLDHQITCPSLLGDFPSSYTGAFVTTYGKKAFGFGRLEVRAAFPHTVRPGIHSALWLFPPGLAYGGSITGEIDLGEFFSLYPDRVIPFLHYQPAHADGSNTNNDCLVQDPWKFHDYVLQWQPGHIVISYDGHTCLDHTIDPAAPLTGSAPFDQPYAINLTQALGVGANAFVPGTTELPATMSVDYVRVWK